MKKFRNIVLALAARTNFIVDSVRQQKGLG